MLKAQASLCFYRLVGLTHDSGAGGGLFQSVGGHLLQESCPARPLRAALLLAGNGPLPSLPLLQKPACNLQRHYNA